MKKMNNSIKKIAVVTTASLLAACAMVPMFTGVTSYAESTIEITNTNTDAAAHVYEAYQIFSGVISGEDANKVLTEIKWGSGIKDGEHQNLLNALATKNSAFASRITYAKKDDLSTEDSDTFESEYNAWKENAEDDSVNAFYHSLDPNDDEDAVIRAMFKQVNTSYTYGGDSDESAAAIADKLANTDDDSELAKTFADVVAKYLSTTKTDSLKVNATQAADGGEYAAYDENDIIIPGLTDGYYLIQDAATSPSDTVAGENNGAKTRFILKVTDDTTQPINAKSAAPSVDKQVWDNEDEEWDETADWNINDKYMDGGNQQAGFKLIANIPANSELKAYESYKIVFNDDMSAGVSFDGIRSIKVIANNKEKVIDPKTTTLTAGYEYTQPDADGKWTLTVNDLTKFMPEGATWGATTLTVEVIYDAHLNENAIVSDADYSGGYSDVNNNNVYLQYSNNPNWDGSGTETLGKTKDDTVGVFTYKIKNTKYANSVGNGNELPGAEFKLYSNADCTTEIALTSVVGEGGISYYIPAAAGATGATMTSQSDGTFNIVGLDVGTYYIKETKAPAGYNIIKDAKPITITATHAESADGAVATLDLTSETMSYTYENKSGTQLPGTGGIGTTIFYLGGGLMTAVGGIYLISKRRTKENE